jgi:hypothetical protein
MYQNATRPDGPSGCIGLLSIAMASVVVSIMIVVAGGMLPLLTLLLPIVLMATLVISAVIGFPLFLLLRWTGRSHWLLVGIAGLITGAVVPALMMLPGPTANRGRIGSLVTVAGQRYLVDNWVPGAALIGGLGLAGFIGALIAQRIALTSIETRSKNFRVVTVLLIAAAVGASACVHALLTDHSCHNPLRDGSSSASPVATFNIHLPRAQWSALRDEFRQFARNNGWSFELGQGEYHRPALLDVDICTEAGTQISAMPSDESGIDIPITVYQPQGGSDWQVSFRALQRRIERRWPGVVSYPFQPPPPWRLLERSGRPLPMATQRPSATSAGTVSLRTAPSSATR